MLYADAEWFEETYNDTLVKCGEGGLQINEAREVVADAFETAVQSGELKRLDVDLLTQGRKLFDEHIGKARERNKTTLRKHMESLVDALNGETILAREDPWLQLPYPLGDGSDKVLLYWSTQDFRTSTTKRYRNAAEVTAAASAHDLIAQRAIDALVLHGVDTVRDALLLAEREMADY